MAILDGQSRLEVNQTLSPSVKMPTTALAPLEAVKKSGRTGLAHTFRFNLQVCVFNTFCQLRRF
jgi:hypothetical protein